MRSSQRRVSGVCRVTRSKQGVRLFAFSGFVGLVGFAGFADCAKVVVLVRFARFLQSRACVGIVKLVSCGFTTFLGPYGLTQDMRFAGSRACTASGVHSTQWKDFRV